jgi:hypothetical protein
MVDALTRRPSSPRGGLEHDCYRAPVPSMRDRFGDRGWNGPGPPGAAADRRVVDEAGHLLASVIGNCGARVG